MLGLKLIFANKMDPIWSTRRVGCWWPDAYLVPKDEVKSTMKKNIYIIGSWGGFDSCWLYETMLVRMINYTWRHPEKYDIYIIPLPGINDFKYCITPDIHRVKCLLLPCPVCVTKELNELNYLKFCGLVPRPHVPVHLVLFWFKPELYPYPWWSN